MGVWIEGESKVAIDHRHLPDQEHRWTNYVASVNHLYAVDRSSRALVLELEVTEVCMSTCLLIV